ncbi:MAG: FAD:protein FMN transferase, partial [Micrococcaceae bacterium]|nr:FAD:protein FMN transferase [Micrococcaceae bacterium]
MTASLSWTVWGLDASLTLTNPACLDAAESIVHQVIDEVERACSRFDPDSELQRLEPFLATGTAISPMLARLVRHGLEAATWTGGAVDPTLGRDLEILGYDRDLLSVQLHPRGNDTAYEPIVRRMPGWERVHLRGNMLTVPGDLRLDLGATAKADAADLAAAAVAAQTGSGVLICLGGDIATAGEGPEGGWQIMVQDLETDPAQQVTLEPGQALATSSTQKR